MTLWPHSLKLKTVTRFLKPMTLWPHSLMMKSETRFLRLMKAGFFLRCGFGHCWKSGRYGWSLIRHMQHTCLLKNRSNRDPSRHSDCGSVYRHRLCVLQETTAHCNNRVPDNNRYNDNRNTRGHSTRDHSTRDRSNLLTMKRMNRANTSYSNRSPNIKDHIRHIRICGSGTGVRYMHSPIQHRCNPMRMKYCYRPLFPSGHIPCREHRRLERHPEHCHPHTGSGWCRMNNGGYTHRDHGR